MNRCRLYNTLISEVKHYLKNGYPGGKALSRRWANKWKPILKDGHLFKDGKRLIPEEEVQKVLKQEAQKGMPLSRDGAFQWLLQRYYGFRRNVVADFINSLETVQLLRKRPAHKTRTNETQTREGTSQVLLKKDLGGKFSVGVDLAFIPRQTENYRKQAWTKYKYLYVAVVQQNNFTFAYPMARKTAVEARRCARLLWKDFQDRYGHPISGLFMDAGTEFQKEHREFWVSKNINPRILSKVWWVEARNSVLMRNIAAMREGFDYKWNYAFKQALEKTNGLYNRKIKTSPDAVTGKQLKAGLKFHNRKLKRQPRKKKNPVFNLKDRVRALTKAAMDVNQVLYKSYNAFRDRKTAIWTKAVYTVQAKKRKGRTMTYQVNGKWYYPWQLQRVDKVVTLEKLKEPEPKKPEKPEPEPKKPALRRSTRKRSQPKWLMESQAIVGRRTRSGRAF